MGGMTKKDKVCARLYCLSAILWFVSSMISKNLVYVPLGCLYLVLGIRYIRNSKNKVYDETKGN